MFCDYLLAACILLMSGPGRLPKLHVISVGVRDGGGVSGEGAAGAGAGVAAAEAEEEFDIEVDDDPSHALSIDASQIPICITFAQIGGRSIVDARQSEELCALSRMMVYVNRSGNICAVETSGTGSISTASLHKSLAVRVVAPTLLSLRPVSLCLAHD